MVSQVSKGKTLRFSQQMLSEKYRRSFFHPWSLRSRWLRHTARRVRSRAWWTHTSETSLPSLPGGSKRSSPWGLHKETNTTNSEQRVEFWTPTETFCSIWNSRQFISSLASSQSTFWLHLLELEMQLPPRHWNWLAEHSVADAQQRKRRCSEKSTPTTVIAR